MAFLEISDLMPFAPGLDPAKAQEMINDASALATLIAPCITADGFTNSAALKAILRGTIVRWLESGSGALQQVTVGQVGQTFDNRQERRSMFWPSEITQLQGLCAGTSSSLYTISLAGP